MRISDWSSDVCSSDLDHLRGGGICRPSSVAQCLRFRNVSLIARRFRLEGLPGQCGLPWPSVNVARQETKMPKLKTKSGVKKRFKPTATGKVKHGAVGKGERTSVETGQSVSVRVGLGGRRYIKKKNKKHQKHIL